MLRSYASSLVIQIHCLVLKQVSKLSKMSNKHTGGDEKIISINLFTLVFSFKVHLCYMIQNKTLHEHVWYVLTLLWFMALGQLVDIMLYLVIRLLPTHFYLKSSRQSKYWQSEPTFPQLSWPTLGLQKGISLKSRHFHWQIPCSFNNTFSTKPAARLIKFKKQLVDDMFRIKNYYYPLNVGIHCVIFSKSYSFKYETGVSGRWSWFQRLSRHFWSLNWNICIQQ